MPGAANPPQASEGGTTDDSDINTAEDTPLLLPSSLDPTRRQAICLQQVAEHEQLLRKAQLQDSLAGLRNARRVRRKLIVNHRTQIAGQGQRANTRSRTVMNSVETRIDKFVERYRNAYRALRQLNPTGDWQKVFFELKDSDNRGPGKEVHEEGLGDGTYFRSWIWSANPQVAEVSTPSITNPATRDVSRVTGTPDRVPRVPSAGDHDNQQRAGPANRDLQTTCAGHHDDTQATDTATAIPQATSNRNANQQATNIADADEEEGATQEEVNEFLRAEWTTSFARLERWTEEVELLQEEMRRVVMFLEWRSKDWLAKVDAHGDTPAPDVRSGLNAYAKKQAAVYHNLAVSFTKLWYPTLESYGLECLWATDYAEEHDFTFIATGVPTPQKGIFKFRLSSKLCDTALTPTDQPATNTPAPTPPSLPIAVKPADIHPLLQEAGDSDNSGLEDSDSDSDFDFDDD